MDVLARALALGCPQGYVRVFADESAPMAALLARLVAAQKAERAAARGVPPGGLAKVLRAFGGKDDLKGAGRGAAVAVPGLVEQLTARELEVLVLLASGMPNPRIAEQLVVTLDTVKKHVSHLPGLGDPRRHPRSLPQPGLRHHLLASASQPVALLGVLSLGRRPSPPAPFGLELSSPRGLTSRRKRRATPGA